MVRCKDCGKLAIPDDVTKRSKIVDARTRDLGKVLAVSGRWEPAQVFCHVGSDVFPGGLIQHEAAVFAKIESEIVCTEWIRFRPGKTPQEHEDMSILEQVRAEQAQFKTDEVRSRTAFEKRQRGHNLSMTLLYVFGTLIAAVIGGLISRHWG